MTELSFLADLSL